MTLYEFQPCLRFYIVGIIAFGFLRRIWFQPFLRFYGQEVSEVGKETSYCNCFNPS